MNKVGEDDDTPLHHAARYRQDRRRTDARGQNRMASPVSLADLSPSAVFTLHFIILAYTRQLAAEVVFC